MKRIGLLGGTFDPVHDGHLQLALAAKNELRLDRVLLIPAAEPPHKCNREITPFAHRRQMLLLALTGVEGLEPCFVEAELPLPSYTVDTVRLLQSGDSGCCDYYFIIGMDAFAELLSWKSYGELLQRVSLIVARRKGVVAEEQLQAIATQLGYRRVGERWTGPPGLRDIHFLKSLPIEISSSQVRHNLASGRTQVEGVAPAVLSYIERHGLYAVPLATARRGAGCSP